VNDICRALIKAIDKPSMSIENLAYGDTRTVQEIVDIFKKVNGLDFKVNHSPRRGGDLVENYLKNPSMYMERNYTYEEMLKI
jgi:UDP-glucose 4-epimerase